MHVSQVAVAMDTLTGITFVVPMNALIAYNSGISLTLILGILAKIQHFPFLLVLEVLDVTKRVSVARPKACTHL